MTQAQIVASMMKSGETYFVHDPLMGPMVEVRAHGMRMYIRHHKVVICHHGHAVSEAPLDEVLAAA